MSDYTVLKQVTLTPAHVATGKTRHVKGGEVLPPAHSLQLVKFDEDGFYLLHFDADRGEVTDTFHATVDDALNQANWEFGIQTADWILAVQRV
ncbi:hypothetical protein [Hydrocarboniphaga sp.]|uniref:hypothetical protein n=1 Tax=Hydrocarboniphaga sp. TaxID=2033016 RepID=UPI002613986D|nr:hypothetical protein [Hydrocarboniphaga sp.]